MHDADGSLYLFGKTAQAHIADPAVPTTRIVDWLLEESLSSNGEHIYYEYQAENDMGLTAADKQRDHAAQRYLKRVRYGNWDWAKNLYLWSNPPPNRWHFDLVLDYGERASTVESMPAYDASGAWLLRQDAFSNYTAGFEVRTHRLCRQVLMFHNFPELGLVGGIVRQYAIKSIAKIRMP
ncbi:hypothetical protein BGZ96_002833 [Linnemannia gamsii]|uniref:Uncharacterized protein n=1 Tax=Linnemannia gamsii TaxID=64522 RepID=A0ABQ7K8C0_9FUNG|nr:hypothetical protein BGZ96_002833 [Linnemannia gamsii]